MILAENVQSVDRVSEALRDLPDRTERDDAGLETWITRALRNESDSRDWEANLSGARYRRDCHVAFN